MAIYNPSSFFERHPLIRSRTELNETLTHVRKWARFGNRRPNFGSSLVVKRGAQKLFIFECFFRRHCNLSVNIFGSKRAVDKREKFFNCEESFKSPTKIRTLNTRPNCIHGARHAGQPSDCSCHPLL